MGTVQRLSDDQIKTRAKDLISQCSFLLNEAETLERRVAYTGLTKTFVKKVWQLRRSFQDVVDADPPAKKAENVISGAGGNLSRFQAIWSQLKRCTGVAELLRQEKIGHAKGTAGEGSNGAIRVKSFEVDIIAGAGEELIKVFTMSERSLLFELARQGHSEDDSSGSDEDVDSHGNSTSLERYKGISVVEMAKDVKWLIASTNLRRNSRHNPHRPTRIRFVFTNLNEGVYMQVDRILNTLRAAGIFVEVSKNLDEGELSIEKTIDQITDTTSMLSQTLNLEHSLLVAMASDIAHRDLRIHPDYPEDVKKDIMVERRIKLLKNFVYPTIVGRSLECLRSVAGFVVEIVNKKGTKSEKRRTSLILGLDDDKPAQAVLQELREMSDYPIPDGIQLPVRIIDDIDLSPADFENHDAVQRVMALELPELDIKALLYGWKMGYTMATASAFLSQNLADAFSAGMDAETDSGPSIWVAPTRRDLLGKAPLHRSIDEQGGNMDLTRRPDDLAFEAFPPAPD